ncbi:MAG TPA: cell division protein SepF [Candidatus Nanoarchaeia archaeon]|nr:cell division protein SepF [Candidatus Nanoarchaeia archaeon]
MAFDLKRMFGKEPVSEDYLEIDVNQTPEAKNRVIVRPFTLKQYDDITDILNALREGYTIAIIDIKQLRTKDVIELKRSVAKIKKTVEAMEGSIAGFGENIVIATPAFAEVHKTIEKINSGSGKKDSLEFY